jgi:hypothetical protein
VATVAEVVNQRDRWPRDLELLATLIEVVDHGNRNFEAAHLRRGAMKRQPIRIPRPGGTARAMSSPDDVRAFMARR